MYYQEHEEGRKLMVSVSKRLYNRAVDRNLVKRKLRELYRLNQNIFTTNHRLALVYVGKSLEDLELLPRKWEKLMVKLEASKNVE